MNVAFLGDNSIQFLVKNFKNSNQDCKVYEAPYNSIDTEILNKDSDLYNFNPDIIVIHESYFSYQDKFYGISDQEKLNFSNEKSQRIFDLYNFLKSVLNDIKIIYTLLHEYDDSIFGTHS